MKLLSKFEKKPEIWFLIIVSFVFFLLRLPSLFEPLWYGDEGIYQVIGLALNHGRLLYRDIWDNKPPLLYLLYAFLHADQTTVRFVSLLFGLIAVILFYFTAKKLFNKSNICYSITSIFALLLALPFLEGNIANAENFIMPLTLGAALLIISGMQKGKLMIQQNKNNKSSLLLNSYFLILFSAGLLLGIAFLFKIVAVFDLAAFTLFIIFMHLLAFPLLGERIKERGKIRLNEKITWLNQVLHLSLPSPRGEEISQFRNLFKEIFTLFIGFLIPLFITIVFFLINHALSDFIHSAFLSNIGYVNYGNQFNLPASSQAIPQGLLIFKLLLLGIFSLILFIKRNKFSPATQFILLWLAFSIFSALFSQRPYTHYLLVLLSSFCLFIGVVLQKAKSQFLFVGIFSLITMYLLINFSFYKKNVEYYQNFLSFISGRETITQYRRFFDPSTPTDYMLADYLNTRLVSNDHLFLWGNNGQLYVLVNKLPLGRYIVAYHMTASTQTLAETQLALAKEQPKFIIIMTNAGQFPHSLTGYTQRLNINNAIIYERNF